MSVTVNAAASPQGAAINPVNLVWVILAFGALTAAIAVGNLWLLNFLHVIAGAMWTGIDLFMGFVIGPILRASPFEARRAVITRLTPKTLFIMPTLSIITGASGWFLARNLGFLDLGYPQYIWVIAALVIVTILTIQGLGYLLPTNLRVYIELRKANPRRRKDSGDDEPIFLCRRVPGLHASRDHCRHGEIRHRRLAHFVQ
jgi:hypothetical protein